MHCPFFLDKICIALSLEAVCSLCSESILCECKRNSLMCCDKVLFHFYRIVKKKKNTSPSFLFPLPPKVNSFTGNKKKLYSIFLKVNSLALSIFFKRQQFPSILHFPYAWDKSWIANGYLIPNSLCLSAVTLEMEPGKCGRKPLIVGF